MEVAEVPSKVVVGQIHIGSALGDAAASTKPLLELFYDANGDVVVGIEQDPLVSNEVDTTIGNVPVGTPFSYSIELTGAGAITVTLNGTPNSFTMPAAFSAYGEYFKAGDYDQTLPGEVSTIGAKVKFYALSVSHS